MRGRQRKASDLEITYADALSQPSAEGRGCSRYERIDGVGHWIPLQRLSDRILCFSTSCAERAAFRDMEFSCFSFVLDILEDMCHCKSRDGPLSQLESEAGMQGLAAYLAQ